MSGLDPLAVSFVTLSLSQGDAALIETIANQISIGDLLAATVLPAQNGVDLIEILGQQVVAQLPPDVHPGETLILQVTGFTGNQILVRNLGQPDPQNPPPVVVSAPPASQSNESVNVTMSPVEGRPSAVDATPRQQPIGPPHEIFVAASVRPAPPSPPTPTTNPAQTALPVDGLNARIAAAKTASSTPLRAQVQTAVQQIALHIVRPIVDLLKLLRVPDTPHPRTAAAFAPQAPARLPAVLQRLNAALPHESTDPRIATLKTLIAFISRINPANEETLSTQLSSYVSHVVEGAEPKMQQLLQPLAQTEPPPAPPGLQKPPHQSPSHAVAQTVSHAASYARAAERATAMEHDLKSIVLSLLRDPPATRTTALMQSLSETYITLTATQLNVLSSSTQTPGTIARRCPCFITKAESRLRFTFQKTRSQDRKSLTPTTST